ncbi:hypothetical protein CEXT_527471 [Caerostris extrusa]|uniref:Uncharacterized protein n=1 Tax=Caerostris extrusa TaxID=172846 RepID=A0AAV4S3J9_CAEEX|nr:hypothetical protein CEXT_527471 [Caerostris extrusa]
MLSISWALYSLDSHPDIQKTVQEELDDIFEDDMERDIRREDLPRMKYLECVIKVNKKLNQRCYRNYWLCSKNLLHISTWLICAFTSLYVPSALAYDDPRSYIIDYFIMAQYFGVIAPLHYGLM